MTTIVPRIPYSWARNMLSMNGSESSIAYRSEENLLMIRPIGLASKNETGAWKQENEIEKVRKCKSLIHISTTS